MKLISNDEWIDGSAVPQISKALSGFTYNDEVRFLVVRGDAHVQGDLSLDRNDHPETDWCSGLVVAGNLTVEGNLKQTEEDAIPLYVDGDVSCQNFSAASYGIILGTLSCRYVYNWIEEDEFKCLGPISVEAILNRKMYDFPGLSNGQFCTIDGDWYGNPDALRQDDADVSWMKDLDEFIVEDLPSKAQTSFERAFQSVFDLGFEGSLLKKQT